LPGDGGNHASLDLVIQIIIPLSAIRHQTGCQKSNLENNNCNSNYSLVIFHWMMARNINEDYS
jgi:hypothetical protein